MNYVGSGLENFWLQKSIKQATMVVVHGFVDVSAEEHA